MPETPLEDPILNLRFLPDWLKETAPSKPLHAEYDDDQVEAYNDGRKRGRERDRRGERKAKGHPQSKKSRLPQSNNRPSDPRDGHAHIRHGAQRDDRNRGPHASGQRTVPGSSLSPRISRPKGNGRERRQDGRSDSLVPPRAAAPEVAPAPVDVSFHAPRSICESILKQIKATSLAYPLFRIAKLFLEQPERHLVRLRMREGTLLRSRLGGALGASRDEFARSLFDAYFSEYYKTTVEEGEDIKGNFTSVARCGLSGQLLGPTNHHSYQSALRSLYNEHYSKKMSFDSYRAKVTVVSDPELVQEWKNRIRKRERYVFSPRPRVEGEAANTHTDGGAADATPTTGEPDLTETPPVAHAPADNATDAAVQEPEAAAPAVAEPPNAGQTSAESDAPVFETRDEAFQHFLREIFPSITEEVPEAEIHGRDAAAITDSGLREAVRLAWEAEFRFPQNLSKEIAAVASKVGLHIFKYEKRFLHVTGTRPVPIAEDLNRLSPGIRKIVDILLQRKQCERPKLLDLVLGDSPRPQGDDMETFKASLASDLRWLIGMGHVIEFSGGLLHLVEGRRPGQPNQQPKHQGKEKSQPPSSRQERKPAQKRNQDTLISQHSLHAEASHEPVPPETQNELPEAADRPHSPVVVPEESSPASVITEESEPSVKVPAADSSHATEAPLPESRATDAEHGCEHAVQTEEIPAAGAKPQVETNDTFLYDESSSPDSMSLPPVEDHAIAELSGSSCGR